MTTTYKVKKKTLPNLQHAPHEEWAIVNTKCLDIKCYLYLEEVKPFSVALKENSSNTSLLTLLTELNASYKGCFTSPLHNTSPHQVNVT